MHSPNFAFFAFPGNPSNIISSIALWMYYACMQSISGIIFFRHHYTGIHMQSSPQTLAATVLAEVYPHNWWST